MLSGTDHKAFVASRLRRHGGTCPITPTLIANQLERLKPDVNEDLIDIVKRIDKEALKKAWMDWRTEGAFFKGEALPDPKKEREAAMQRWVNTNPTGETPM
jgi:hypothetical protein